MKPLRDQEEVEEVEPEQTLEEEKLGEEDQVDATTMMSKATWLEIVFIRGNHGDLNVELMGTQLNTSHNLLQNMKIEYGNEDLTSSVQR